MPLRLSIETYIHAKDGNRPHLLVDAFTVDAELEMEVNTDEISFPRSVKGLNDISAVLVSQFAQRYENVYTICMGEPPGDATEFSCDWLVCMTEKESGAARVGFGRYDWLRPNGSEKVSKLKITIEDMTTLPRELSQSILAWVRALPYPWCPHNLPVQSAPDIASVQEIARRLERCTL